MTIPEATTTVRDGALGLLPDNVEGVHVKCGVCSSGTVSQIYSFTDQATLVSTLGTGPLVEAAAHALAVAGGPVYCMRVTGSVAGTTGSVTEVGTGPAMTAAGAATDTFDAKVTVTRGGALGVGAFTYTLDGGDTVSAETTIPSGGTYLIPGTGVTLTFPSGTYVAGDTYAFTTVAPGFSTSDVTAACTALLADPRDWSFLHLVGAAASVAAAATMAAVLDTQMALFETNFRYVFALMECPTDTDSNTLAAFAAFTSLRVSVAAGYEELASPISGQIRKRSAAWVAAARMALVPIHEHLGRVERGALPGVTPTAALPTGLYRDERVTQGLDAGRFLTLRTHVGLPGAFITRGRLMSPAGSDFDQVQKRRVMDVACRVARARGLRYLNSNARTDKKTGFIDERDARVIEKAVTAAVAAALLSPGHVSDVQATVKRDEPMLSTKKLVISIRVLPLGEAEYVAMDLGFENPALTPVVK